MWLTYHGPLFNIPVKERIFTFLVFGNFMENSVILISVILFTNIINCNVYFVSTLDL